MPWQIYYMYMLLSRHLSSLNFKHLFHKTIFFNLKLDCWGFYMLGYIIAVSKILLHVILEPLYITIKHKCTWIFQKFPVIHWELRAKYIYSVSSQKNKISLWYYKFSKTPSYHDLWHDSASAYKGESIIHIKSANFIYIKVGWTATS